MTGGGPDRRREASEPDRTGEPGGRRQRRELAIAECSGTAANSGDNAHGGDKARDYEQAMPVRWLAG